jgi:hypothetical protein
MTIKIHFDSTYTHTHLMFCLYAKDYMNNIYISLKKILLLLLTIYYDIYFY